MSTDDEFEAALIAAIGTAFKEEGMFATYASHEPADAHALRLSWAIIAAGAALSVLASEDENSRVLGRETR